MTEAQRLTSYTHGDGPFHDEINIGIETLMRRQIANALRISPADVVFTEHLANSKRELAKLITHAQRTFDTVIGERIAEIEAAGEEES